ncbi:hypothetical protein AGMMS49975_14640 [Clostridia bacterium]|nr:hypothetical protein AGMMS49975_14640 [Clostridia bacterium]
MPEKVQCEFPEFVSKPLVKCGRCGNDVMLVRGKDGDITKCQVGVFYAVPIQYSQDGGETFINAVGEGFRGVRSPVPSFRTVICFKPHRIYCEKKKKAKENKNFEQIRFF